MIPVLDKTLADLNDLLDIKVHSPNPSFGIESGIQAERDQILDFVENGEVDRASYHLVRLQMFSKHLNEVRVLNPGYFSDKVEDLTSETGGNYYGDRFEIDVAASLLRKGIKFKRVEPPDFRFSYDGDELDIEAKSAHFESSDADIKEKIKRAIRSKTDDSYSHPTGVVFIDLTNVFFEGLRRNITVDSPTLRQWADETTTNFPSVSVGAIVFFNYVVETSEEGQTGLHHAYTIYENSDMSDTLLEFLADHFEIDEEFEIMAPYSFDIP